jgi:hypothetical protein
MRHLQATENNDEQRMLRFSKSDVVPLIFVVHEKTESMRSALRFLNLRGFAESEIRGG